MVKSTRDRYPQRQPARGKGRDTVCEHPVVSLFLNLSKLTGVESKLLARIQPWTILYRDVMMY